VGLSVRTFYLNRKEDHTGISGTGIVARGVILPSGKCVMEWQTKHTSVSVYASLDEVRAIHGHDGKTEIVIDPSSNAVRLQALREAANAVHRLRPFEIEHIGGNRYLHDIVYPHVLKRWGDDRDAVADLIPKDWREQLQAEGD
jgi:hypothetical protein